jgi:hypothetical protein
VQRTDFYQEPIPVGAPNWPSINPSPASVNVNATHTPSPTPGNANSRYLLSSLSVSGGQTLTLAGNPDGSKTYIELYVTGDITVGGSSQIVLQPGVTAKIYFRGNVSIGGNGMMNPNNQPGDLLLYGVEPPEGTTPQVSLGGNGQITAAVYAPDYDVTVNGGGNSGHVFGSIVGKTTTMNGVTNLHYDEALAATGILNNYKIVSWFEDTR